MLVWELVLSTSWVSPHWPGCMRVTHAVPEGSMCAEHFADTEMQMHRLVCSSGCSEEKPGYW